MLDVGCGTGNYSIALAKMDAKVTAIDISKEAIAIAREKARKAGVPVIGLVENMPGGIFGEGTTRKLCKGRNTAFLGMLPLCKEIAESGTEGKPFSELGNAELSGKFNPIMGNILKNEKR